MLIVQHVQCESITYTCTCSCCTNIEVANWLVAIQKPGKFIYTNRLVCVHLLTGYSVRYVVAGITHITISFCSWWFFDLEEGLKATSATHREPVSKLQARLSGNEQYETEKRNNCAMLLHCIRYKLSKEIFTYSKQLIQHSLPHGLRGVIIFHLLLSMKSSLFVATQSLEDIRAAN